MKRTEYNNIHLWIRKNHGKATECSFDKSHTGKRFEWALIKGKYYERNIDNYIQLCPSCHRKYDMTDEIRKNASIRMKANPADPLGVRLPSQAGKFGADHQTSKSIIKMDKLTGVVIESYGSLTDAINDNGYKYANLSMCLTGKNKTAYGYKWQYNEK